MSKIQILKSKLPHPHLPKLRLRKINLTRRTKILILVIVLVILVGAGALVGLASGKLVYQTQAYVSAASSSADIQTSLDKLTNENLALEETNKSDQEKVTATNNQIKDLDKQIAIISSQIPTDQQLNDKWWDVHFADEEYYKYYEMKQLLEGDPAHALLYNITMSYDEVIAKMNESKAIWDQKQAEYDQMQQDKDSKTKQVNDLNTKKDSLNKSSQKLNAEISANKQKLKDYTSKINENKASLSEMQEQMYKNENITQKIRRKLLLAINSIFRTHYSL